MAYHREEKPIKELLSDLSTTMNTTLSEIKERLSTNHLKGRTSEATVDWAKCAYDSASTRTRELGSQLRGTIARHRWSIALAGTGAAAGIGGLVYFLHRKNENHGDIAGGA